jgi:hypothetical protein
MTHPRDLGDDGIEQFLSDLATNRGVSASTRNQAVAAHLLEFDIAESRSGVSLPAALARKYPNARLDWAWQYDSQIHYSAVDRNGG